MAGGWWLAGGQATFWAKLAHPPGVEWAAGKWAEVVHAFTPEKKGDLALRHKQIIR